MNDVARSNQLRTLARLYRIRARLYPEPEGEVNHDHFMAMLNDLIEIGERVIRE